jgi:hypothetical protein
MKKTYYLILVLLIFAFIGCGGKEIKPSADSVLTREVLGKIDAIRTAYQEKDKTALESHMDSILAERISKGLFFTNAELSFTPKKINISSSTVTVNLNWQGTWIVRGKNIKKQGVSVFVFEGIPIKLISLDGDNPFQTPAIRE